MKITADYHVHSAFSGDSKTPMESMIEKAISLGLTRICFTDHIDYDYPAMYLDEGRPFEFNIETYLNKIHTLQITYKNDIKILTGIELGVRPYLAPRLNKLVETYPFDFVIASSHLIGPYDPYFPDYWKSIYWDGDTGIRQYFDSIIENVEAFTNFDVYGHLDYIVRYVPDKNFHYEPEKYQEHIDRLLKAIIKAGRGIEVNTAGLKYGLPFAHPKEELLKRFFALGGKYITIGSDAHKPEHLCYDFEKEAGILKQLGVTQYAVFDQRKPLFEKI